MIRLGEIVAAVLSEMAMARTRATLFAAQMAADFRGHEVLKDLPIPVYRIGSAEISLSVAVARVSSSRSMLSLPLEPSDAAEVGQRVSDALVQEPELREAFSQHERQREEWRREAAPVIAQRFGADASLALSVEGLSAVYGYLAKEHYMLSLIRRGERLGEARHLDLVERTARRLMRIELEGLLTGLEEKAEAPSLSAPALAAIDYAVYVHVEAGELKEREQAGVLKLELEEGVLVQATFSEQGEVGSE